MACIHDSLTVGRIKKDIAAGAHLGVSGTPTVLINGLRIDGALSQEALEALVQRAAQQGA